MVHLVSSVSVAQSVTIINAIVTFINVTISLSLVILLIYFMPNSNTALAWNSIGRTLQSSIWPVILRTDSQSGRSHGTTVPAVGVAAAASTALVAIAGILLPLGLSEGPSIVSNFRQIDSRYIPDDSTLALATTPERGTFTYGRTCGYFEGLDCPGKSNPNDTSFPPQLVETFNSTPHGPFAMEYRVFFNREEPQKPSVAIVGGAQTFILRNDTFVAEGLVIDMSTDHPGIGFWNQTLPSFQNGGTWSQDVLWLEPVTQCVDTNLTIDYFMTDGPQEVGINTFNLTDHGGFVNLAFEPLTRDPNHHGQDTDLRQRAFTAAGSSNLFAMEYLNLTHGRSSYLGASYPLKENDVEEVSARLGAMDVIPTSYLNSTAELFNISGIYCAGFGGLDTANLTNIHVSCGIFLGPPLRTDGGNPRKFDPRSKWSQNIHACTSATRASIQTTTFSTNDTDDIHNMYITRVTSNIDALWAIEKANFTIENIDLLWGRVADKYESDPSLWTVRADHLYLPAGGASIDIDYGIPSSMHATVWGQVYHSRIGLTSTYVADYSGKSDYSIKTKMQSLVSKDPTLGTIQIQNLIWTDLMSNNLIGTQANRTAWAAEHLRTLQYDLRYAIPGFLLLFIWLPSFLGAIFLLTTRYVTFGRMRAVLNHVSVGRVAVGASALRVQHGNVGPVYAPPSRSPTVSSTDIRGDIPFDCRGNKDEWASKAGNIIVSLNLETHLDNRASHMEREEEVELVGTPHY